VGDGGKKKRQIKAWGAAKGEKEGIRGIPGKDKTSGPHAHRGIWEVWRSRVVGKDTSSRIVGGSIREQWNEKPPTQGGSTRQESEKGKKIFVLANRKKGKLKMEP